MALIQQSYVLHLLNECEAYSSRREKQLQQSVIKRLEEIHRILKKNIRQTFNNFSLEVIVRFTQIAVEIEEKFHYAEEFVDLFFQRIEAPSQFYIRQLVVKAKVIALKGSLEEKKGQDILQILKTSIFFISKALDLISGPQQTVAQKGKDSKGEGSKCKYGFLVYNASGCLYKITRFFLRSSWQKSFSEIYDRIYKLFEQLQEPSHDWRCRFSLILFQCLYDSEKKAEAFKILDSLWQKTKVKHCDFQDSLFKLRVHLSKQNNALAAIIKKDIETNPNLQWGALELLQKMKSGAIPQSQIQKELMTVVNTTHDGILSTNQQASTILSPIKQERLAQAARIALKHNIISIASSITNFLSKARQPNQKAMILNEYNKAELLIKKKGQFIDKKTGMMMSPQQIKTLQIQYRKQALKILEKVMIINKKLNNADLIYEGTILIWNISLPFMCPQYRSVLIKPFEISVSLLEQIDSIDHDLRTKMHLQLAKIFFGNQTMFIQVQSNIMKAIKLDPSIPLNKITFKFESSQNVSLYQRPYERYLEDFREKILLKTMQNIDLNPLNTVTQDLWNVADQKSETTRIDILQKCLKNLLTLEENSFDLKEEEMLVDEEINQKKMEFERKKLANYKKKKLLASEVAQFAFQWDLNDFAKKACEMVLSDKWESQNSVQMIIAQCKCFYFMTQIKIDELTNENFEFCLKNCRKVNEDDNKQMISEAKVTEIDRNKVEIIGFFKNGLKLAESIQQHWLVFNGSIYLWNNCLHILRNPSNDPELLTQLIQLLQLMFQSMRKSLEQIQRKNIVYYDLDTKIQTFANIGLVLARIKELQKKPEQVLKTCESLLSTSLSPHTRKLINGVKARIQKSGVKVPDNKKGGKQPPVKTGSNDAFLLDIITQLQVIQNSTNKSQTQNLIKKCFENLQAWKPKEQDEPELQLHAQLWVRLARLALNQQTANLYKYCLRSCENSLFYLDKKGDISSLPFNRLRWYSLAEFLYSECLMRICNPETQEAASVEKIRFMALSKAVLAVEKGYKCNINILVLDAAKQVWNISAKLQQTQLNRTKLMPSLKSTLFYLKQMKEDSQTDLILLLSELYFKAALENNEFKAGEDMSDMLLALVPKTLQRSLWEAKMIFMSKQGKNELHAISSIKQADPSLQAKLWVKLARVSIQPTKQHMAYNKALDILKKEHSVQIVQVLMEYAEWQSRVSHENVQAIKSSLLLASDYLIDIEYGQDEEQEEGEEEKGTVFSRSTRGKKSVVSKSMKSGLKINQSKKPTERKGPLSVKSKGGTSSRMNRSGRVTKTAKTKNTKSIFSLKQEDPNPQTLNCLHFERLFRIHTTLALISQSQEEKIRYALDAKQFLVKMYHLSIKSFNELLQNAGKFSEHPDKKDSYKPLKFPKTPEDWVKLELPKEFVERINSFENFNFMGSYAFQKPQLTLAYLSHLLRIFDEYGLSVHSLPVNFLARYISKFILNNDLLYKLLNIKLKRTLTSINSHCALEINEIIDFQNLNITVAQFNRQLQKAHNSKVYERNQNLFFENNPLPTLVEPITKYQIWAEIGQVLVDQGRLSLAMKFLQKAQAPAKILMDNAIITQILTSQAKINYYEGQFNQSIIKSLEANKICKSIRLWPDLILITCEGLMELKKYENTKRLIGQVQETVCQLIEESKQSVNSNSNFLIDLLPLKQLLLFTKILKPYQKIMEIISDEVSPEYLTELAVSINELKEGLLKGVQVKCNVGHCNLFMRLARQIFRIFATGAGMGNIELNLSIFTTVFQIALKLEKNVLEINKYCWTGEGEIKENLINGIHRQLRYLLVEGYHIKELLKQSSSNNDEQESDHVDELGQQNEMLRKYVETLKRQIQQRMCPIPTNLQPSQSAIAILDNLKPAINKDGYEYVRWFSYYTLSQTLRAQTKHQLGQIWDQKANIEELSSQYAILSLQTTENFLQECQNKLINYHKDPACYLNAERSYLSLINNTGAQLPDQCFEFISKYQHSCYNENILQIIKQNLKPTHKYLCTFRLLDNTKIDLSVKQTLNKGNQILDAYSKFPDYSQAISLLPLNSLTIILQLSRCKTELYFGCYVNCSNPQDRKFLVKKKDLSKAQLKSLLSMKKSLTKVKKNMLKTPFQNSQKISKAIQENESILSVMNKKFEEFNKWWLNEIMQLINKPKHLNTQPTEQAGKDKDKKASKDPKKKPATKDQLSAYESPLEPSPSGIDSITFLLDHLLYSLPFEHLSGLQTVPAVSKDTTLFYLARKLTVLNFQPDLNNSNGFGLEKGKFLSYDFKHQNLNFTSILNSLKNPTLKMNGTSSTQRVPAPGDLVDYLGSPGYLQIYGNISLLNKFKVESFINSINKTGNFLILVADNLNFRKETQERHVDLIQGADIPLEFQEQTLVAVLNLLNMNMVKLRWNVEESETVEIIKSWYQKLSQGLYIGNLMRFEHKQSKQRVHNTPLIENLLFSKLSTFVHGAPILRI